jgi:NADPH-dependent curcumin reductase CurA
MNKQIILAKRPTGLPEEDTWQLTETPIPSIEDGQVLVKQLYISLDPAMRGWISDRKSYIPPVQIGEVMRAGSVGKIIASKHPEFEKGMHLMGWGGVQQYAVTDGKGWFPVNPDMMKLPTYISALGMPGMTAYFGLLDIGQPKEGETVLVSGAAGAVGSVVGQIAKIKGCRAVGIAGGPEKCKYIVEELGFDGAVDYKNEDLHSAIKRECPDGIDIYFDNVGGEILDTALTLLNMHARIPICGAISQYNATTPMQGPSNYMALLVFRARMEGFLVMDYTKDFPKAAMEMAGWMIEGKLKSKEDIYEGIENFHETFLRLFSGKKLGKLVLKVNEEDA